MNAEKKSIEIINNSIYYKPLLTGSINRDQICIKLNELKGRFFNYVLLIDGEITYIGYTANLYQRLMAHKIGSFTKALVLEFSSKELARANERAMIKEVKPRRNYQYCR